MISVVVPILNETEQQKEITKKCLENLVSHAAHSIELIVVDNGSPERFDDWPEGIYEKRYVRHNENRGVLNSFRDGLDWATRGVIAFLHSDVLVHEYDWDEMIENAFKADHKLGLAGFFGARGTGTNGGREGSMSKMLGQEWGKVEGAQPAALHHGEVITEVTPAGGLDGLAMIFRTSAMEDLAKTDIFDNWRAPHHFYDRIIPGKMVDLGYRIAVIPVGFDHWSGATANSSTIYQDFAEKWCKSHNIPFEENWDHSVYLEAERQFFKEFGSRLPLRVDHNYNYTWGGR